MKLFENRNKKEIDQYYLWFQQNLESFLEKAKVFLEIEELLFTIEEVDEFGIRTKALIDIGMSDEAEYGHANIFIAYYGTAWMHYFGGKWYFTNSKKEWSYGLPQIIEYNSPDWVAICPLDYYECMKRGDDDSLSVVISRELKFNNRKKI